MASACQVFRAQLEAIATNSPDADEPSDETFDAVEHHLQTCDDCRRALERT